MNLTDFCAPNRFRLAAPWREGNYVYATTGQIMIEVAAADYPEITAEGEIDPADAFADMWPTGAVPWQPMPPVGPQTMQECPDCEGKGFESKDCPTCDGRGYCECSKCGDEHDCGECDGEGEVLSDVKCAACDGQGERFLPADQRLCGSLYAGEYCALLAGLPNAHIAPSRDGNGLAFRFDGGRGLLMKLLVGGEVRA